MFIKDQYSVLPQELLYTDDLVQIREYGRSDLQILEMERLRDYETSGKYEDKINVRSSGRWPCSM